MDILSLTKEKDTKNLFNASDNVAIDWDEYTRNQQIIIFIELHLDNLFKSAEISNLKSDLKKAKENHQKVLDSANLQANINIDNIPALSLEIETLERNIETCKEYIQVNNDNLQSFGYLATNKDMDFINALFFWHDNKYHAYKHNKEVLDYDINFIFNTLCTVNDYITKEESLDDFMVWCKKDEYLALKNSIKKSFYDFLGYSVATTPSDIKFLLGELFKTRNHQAVKITEDGIKRAVVTLIMDKFIKDNKDLCYTLYGVNLHKKYNDIFGIK